MTPNSFDLFDFWRWFLAVACTAYAVVVTVRWAWSWLVYLSGGDRSIVLLRHYLIASALRLRVWRFGAELVQIAGWSTLVILLLRYDSRLMIGQ